MCSIKTGTRAKVAAWLVVVGLASGCQSGILTDRNVQISEHWPAEDSGIEPTATRLTPAGMASSATAPAAQRHAQNSPLSDLVNDRSRGSAEDQQPVADEVPQADEVTQVAHREPTGNQADPADDTAAGVSLKLSDLDGDEGEADLAELLAAFRHSPPEIQEQAIRQLIAAVTHRANRTAQPSNIRSQLSGSIQDLPELSDDYEDHGLLPARLGTQGEPADAIQEAVSRAVADDGPTDPGVQAASASLSNPQPTAEPQHEPLAEPAAEIAVQEAVAEPKSEAELYADLITLLKAPQPGESDGDRFRRRLAMRYLQVLSGDPDAAVDEFDGLKQSEQEFLRHHLLALWNMTDPGGHPVASRRLATALPKLRTATQNLAAATEHLDVRSLAFCTEITTYGLVKRFPSSRFEKGQKVILYCEIDNFVADKTAAGFQTELQGSYEIFADDGTKVAGQVLPVDQQTWDQYLRDFYIAYKMHLPEELAPGDYRLALTMECLRGRKYGQASIPFTIKK